MYTVVSAESVVIVRGSLYEFLQRPTRVSQCNGKNASRRIVRYGYLWIFRRIKKLLAVSKLDKFEPEKACHQNFIQISASTIKSPAICIPHDSQNSKRSVACIFYCKKAF